MLKDHQLLCKNQGIVATIEANWWYNKCRAAETSLIVIKRKNRNKHEHKLKIISCISELEVLKYHQLL